MPITYACDHCGHTAASLAGWFMVSINLLHDEPSAPTPPGGRTLDATLPDHLFDTVECRDAWCTQAGLTMPAQAPTNA
jgi:hypothetical protein